MQIKFNKIVKPISPQQDETRPNAPRPTAPPQSAPAPMTPPQTAAPNQTAPVQNQMQQPAPQPQMPAAPQRPVPPQQPAYNQQQAQQMYNAQQAQPAPQPQQPPQQAYSAPPQPQTRTMPPPQQYAPQQAATPISMIEQNLKKFVGKQVRVYMADHENITGRLESVENGWIKVSNARSAGGDYYSDIDEISIPTIVRLRYSQNIEKSDYVEFMNFKNSQ